MNNFQQITCTIGFQEQIPYFNRSLIQILSFVNDSLCLFSCFKFDNCGTKVLLSKNKSLGKNPWKKCYKWLKLLNRMQHLISSLIIMFAASATGLKIKMTLRGRVKLWWKWKVVQKQALHIHVKLRVELFLSIPITFSRHKRMPSKHFPTNFLGVTCLSRLPSMI